MENAPEPKDSSQCVRVAVNIRPLVTAELAVGCTDCITVISGEPQIQIGSHMYTFDHVFGSTGQKSVQIYDECVAPLVDALLHGYNGTVLAYGQTGSGKTYTMGTNYNGEGHHGGIIPKVMETIFSRVEGSKDSTEFLIRVSFIEIFKEEVFDLLDTNQPISSRGDGLPPTKPAGIARVPIQIRENCNGGITLAGVTEAEVKTKEEMASYLLRGSFARASASTNMNSQSSRSHAIFTISMEQKKVASCQNGAAAQDGGDDILFAKLHLVDLAGSERAKRTGADGTRLREGIHINKGLLALGNVISALGDDRKRKKGGHVPYRDSKLTRLLQDSLGGNSKTFMIACVSPAETNAEETLNTLKYANRARNIQNKAVINRDPMAAQVQRMRSQIENLQAEVLFLRGDPGVSSEETQNLKHEISLLQARNADLHWRLQECQVDCEHARQLALDSQVEKDKLIMKIESARTGKSWDEIDSNSDQDSNLVKTYVEKIQELERKLLRFQNLNKAKEHVSEFVKRLELGDGLHSMDSYSADLSELSSDTQDVDTNGEVEGVDKIKEQEHSSLQEQLDLELKELDRKLEQKEENLTKDDARQQLLRILRILPYGNSVFFSVRKIDDPIGLLPGRIILGINKRGVHFIRPVPKEYLHSAELRDIMQFGSSNTAVFFKMRVAGVLHIFQFETKQGEEICVALQTHINDVMLRRWSKARTVAGGSVNGDISTPNRPPSVDIFEKRVQDLSNALEESQRNATQAEMKQFANVDTSVIKQHYDRKVQDLENEKKALQNEIEVLKRNIANVPSNSDESAQKLKGDYLQKLNFLEAQVTQLKKKQDAQAQLLRHKQRSDEAAKRLQDEIQRIKTYKPKKEGRRNEFEMHKLLALNQRQKMVLQRKTEEAAMAIKRLKELLERKASSREATGGNGPGVQALMQAIKHELEVTVRVHEVRSEYERQMEERTRMAKEVADLKEEAQNSQRIDLSNCSQSMSSGARNSRIYALETMLSTTSSTLVAMASQLSEAEERERAFSGRGCWHHVRSLAEAKSIMNYLFNLVSSSRCLIWDKEVASREKDSEIKDLKEKVLSLVRQHEIQKMAFIRQEKLQKLALKRQSKENTVNSLDSAPNGKSRVFDLRYKDSRSSMVFSNMGNSVECVIDISDAELSGLDDIDDMVQSDLSTKDDDPEWVASVKQLAKKRNSRKSHAVAVQQPIYVSDSESNKTESSGEQLAVSDTKKSSGVCCTCSRKSLCKRKCECRDAGGSCGASCNCAPTKCTNRGETSTKDSEPLGGSEVGEASVRTGDQDLASHALDSKHLSDKDTIGGKSNDEDLPKRKLLSDIGNSTAKPNVPKPSMMRKKWKNPLIQLVPSDPTSQPDKIEISGKPDSSEVQPEIPLRLPRAMRSAASISNPLREKNSQEAHSSNTIKDGEKATPNMAPQIQRMTDEKEN